MPIIVSDSGTFTPAPEGQHQAVLCDVVELHDVPTPFGPKNKVRLVFQLDEKMPDGRPYLASRSFGATLNERGTLRPFLEAWRGKKFTTDELRSFDLEALIGVNAIIQILHEQKNGKTYDNIQTAMKLMKGMTPIAVEGYTRKKDRPVGEQNGRANGEAGETAGHGPGMPGSYVPDPSEYEDPDDGLPF